MAIGQTFIEDAGEVGLVATEAFELEANRPVLDLLSLLEAQEELASLLVVRAPHEARRVDAAAAATSSPLIRKAAARVKKELPQDIDAAVYYKAAAELHMMGGSHQEANALLKDAQHIFQSDRSNSEECAEELKVCEQLLAICEKQELARVRQDVRQKQRARQGLIGTAPLQPLSLASSGAADCNPTLRPLVATDVQAVVDMCRTLGTPCVLSSLSTSQISVLTNTSGCCWVAEAKERAIVGAVIASTDCTFGYIRQVVVAPGVVSGDALQASLQDRVAKQLKAQGVLEVQMFGTNLNGSEKGHAVYTLMQK